MLVVVVLRLRIETSRRKTEFSWFSILAARRRRRTRWSRGYGRLRIVIIAGSWSCKDGQKEGENGEKEKRESHDGRYLRTSAKGRRVKNERTLIKTSECRRAVGTERVYLNASCSTCCRSL